MKHGYKFIPPPKTADRLITRNPKVAVLGDTLASFLTVVTYLRRLYLMFKSISTDS